MTVWILKKLHVASLIVALLTFTAMQLLINRTYNTYSKNGLINARAAIEDMKEGLTSSVQEGKPNTTEFRSVRNSVVDGLIEQLKRQTHNFFPMDFFKMSMHDFTRRLGREVVRNSTKLSHFAHVNMSAPLSAWNLMHANIRQHALYDPDDANIDTLMHNMATLPILSVDMIKDGSQLNMLVKLKDGTKTVMKAMRVPRDRDELNDTFYFDFMERHTSEIAGFHLDKVLGFYRVPPTVGRKVNILTELMSVAVKDLKDTIFKSDVNNTCFYGQCRCYCDIGHGYCGNPDVIEVSMMVFLSPVIKQIQAPWQPSFSYTKKAAWETDDNYCNNVVRRNKYFKDEHVLRETVDAYIFDYMTGNEDRHRLYYLQGLGQSTYSIIVDNGKGFGRHSVDSPSKLKPLLQCCLLKKSTVLKFIKLYIGPEHLSSLMKRSLSSDPVAPILTTGHLQALDRRVVKVLRAMASCIDKHGINKVII